jgi:hypothetical protein
MDGMEEAGRKATPEHSQPQQLAAEGPGVLSSQQSVSAVATESAMND